MIGVEEGQWIQTLIVVHGQDRIVNVYLLVGCDSSWANIASIVLILAKPIYELNSKASTNKQTYSSFNNQRVPLGLYQSNNGVNTSITTQTLLP